MPLVQHALSTGSIHDNRIEPLIVKGHDCVQQDANERENEQKSENRQLLNDSGSLRKQGLQMTYHRWLYRLANALLYRYLVSPRLRSYRITFQASSSSMNRSTTGSMPVPGICPVWPMLPFFRTHIISPGVRTLLNLGLVKSRGWMGRILAAPPSPLPSGPWH